MASVRKRTNYVDAIIEDQIQLIDHPHKAKAFFRHFVKLVGTAHIQDIEFDYNTLYENQSHNPAHLVAPITLKELMEVIKQLPTNKASGPDGYYTNEFFKKFKDIIIPDLIVTYQNILQSNSPSLFPLNDSYIALIPKKKSSTTTDDFRPISLIHQVQKLQSKTLANMLKRVVQDFILPSQTRFLQGSFINERFL